MQRGVKMKLNVRNYKIINLNMWQCIGSGLVP
jgi:hypothetical protein